MLLVGKHRPQTKKKGEKRQKAGSMLPQDKDGKSSFSKDDIIVLAASSKLFNADANERETQFGGTSTLLYL
jgi:hypothetical protein